MGWRDPHSLPPFAREPGKLDEPPPKYFPPLLFLPQLRKDTHARINVDLEESGDERMIRISGSPVQVCKAKAAIHQILEESLPVVEKISVPNRAIGRIIGTRFLATALQSFPCGEGAARVGGL